MKVRVVNEGLLGKGGGGCDKPKLFQVVEIGGIEPKGSGFVVVVVVGYGCKWMMVSKTNCWKEAICEAI